MYGDDINNIAELTFDIVGALSLLVVEENGTLTPAFVLDGTWTVASTV